MKSVFLSLFFLSFIGVFSAHAGYEVGDVVGEFDLLNVDGKNVSLNDYDQEKGLIVVFTCNHCPYAKLYEERIIELHKTYASQGYPVVAINPNDPEKVPEDSYGNMKKRAKSKGYPFPYLFDETQDVAKNFGATRTPHVFLLERTTVQYKVAYIGAIDNNPQSAESADKFYVSDAIGDLVNSQPVKVTETKAVGCTIKWK